MKGTITLCQPNLWRFQDSDIIYYHFKSNKSCYKGTENQPLPLFDVLISTSLMSEHPKTISLLFIVLVFATLFSIVEMRQTSFRPNMIKSDTICQTVFGLKVSGHTDFHHKCYII